MNATTHELADYFFEPRPYTPPPPVLRLELQSTPIDTDVEDAKDDPDANILIELIAYGYKPEPYALLEFVRTEVDRMGFNPDGRGYIEDRAHGVASWSFRLVFLERKASA